MENEEKVKAVRKERNKLKKIFQGIDENKLKFVTPQIERLAWLIVTIRILEKSIDENGTMLEYNNGGGQKGKTSNPDVATLDKYTKNMNTIYKQLIDLVPVHQKSKLLEFMNG